MLDVSMSFASFSVQEHSTPDENMRILSKVPYNFKSAILPQLVAFLTRHAQNWTVAGGSVMTPSGPWPSSSCRKIEKPKPDLTSGRAIFKFASGNEQS